MTQDQDDADNASRLPHPFELEVLDFPSYGLVIDARSPREFNEDHIPGAVNLPVVNDEEYAQVGTKHREDTHEAYLIGVEYSLINIARQIRPLIAKHDKSERMLVYCFRGGKRSKLWADNLRTIGYEVDVLKGGWKNYRRWVRASLDVLPNFFELRVLSGATGTGKTRLLKALSAAGEQVIDLEELASHRGSLIGAVPGVKQPTQKMFDSAVVDIMRGFDRSKPVWLEDESKRIGNIRLPDALHEAMQRGQPIHVQAPMHERVRLWREDYSHFVDDPIGMVRMLAPLKPLVGGAELTTWSELAEAERVDELFERVMTQHYDPCYTRSSSRLRPGKPNALTLELDSLDPAALTRVASELANSPQALLGKTEKLPAGPAL